MNTDLRESDLLRTYTTSALEATWVYKYRFVRKATYCVHIRLVRSRQIVCTSTALRVNRLIAYVYDLCVQVIICV